MNTYFKYTQGEAFTLDGEDYTGSVHINDNLPYTGRLHKHDSRLLQGKDTFAADVIINKMNINRTVSSIFTIQSVDKYILHNNVLDKDNISNIIETLTMNNLEIYKSQFISPMVEILDISDTNTIRYYGLSATEADIRLPDDVLTAKNNTYSQIDPFSFSEKWSFLDEVVSGDIILGDNDDFLYYITTDTGAYTLKGNLVNDSELIVVQSTALSSDTLLEDDLSDSLFSPGSHIKSNSDSSIVFEITNNTIILYDAYSYNLCENLVRINEIDLTKFNIDIIDYIDIAIGDNLVYIVDKDYKIHVINIADSSITLTIDTSSQLGIGTIYSVAARDQDNVIIIFSDIGITAIDIDSAIIYGISSATLINQNIVYKGSYENVSIAFSSKDSNVFFILSRSGMETRYIDNPKYPASFNLFNSLDSSDLKDESNTDLLFLDDYTFNNTKERFDKTIIKFNSNKLESNSPNILNISFNISDNRTVIVLHFIGRIYTMVYNYTGDADDAQVDNIDQLKIKAIADNIRNTSAVRLDRTANVDMYGLCNRSTASITINTAFKSLIADTITLYNAHNIIWKSNNGYTLNDSADNNSIKIINEYDLMLHSNEGINVHSLNRIINSLYDLQKSLIDRINSFAIS